MKSRKANQMEDIKLPIDLKIYQTALYWALYDQMQSNYKGTLTRESFASQIDLLEQILDGYVTRILKILCSSKKTKLFFNNCSLISYVIVNAGRED